MHVLLSNFTGRKQLLEIFASLGPGISVGGGGKSLNEVELRSMVYSIVK